MQLATLATPKLLIAGGPNSSNPIRNLGQLQSLFRHAASPSYAVTFPSRLRSRLPAALTGSWINTYPPTCL